MTLALKAFTHMGLLSVKFCMHRTSYAQDLKRHVERLVVGWSLHSMSAPQSTKPRTKVVVRGLPPGMPEATLVQVLEELEQGALRGKYSWLAYVQGKVR